jgi:hypothetical protein
LEALWPWLVFNLFILLMLAVIALLLIVSIVASFLFPKSAHENVSALGAVADPLRTDDHV